MLPILVITNDSFGKYSFKREVLIHKREIHDWRVVEEEEEEEKGRSDREREVEDDDRLERILG